MMKIESNIFDEEEVKIESKDFKVQRF